MEPVREASEESSNPLVPVTIADEVASATGRRRPGRLENINPNLLPLLRKAERDQLPTLPEGSPVALISDIDVATQAFPPFVRFESRREWFGEGEGVALGVVLGTLFWAGLASGAWAIVRYLS